MNSCIFIDGFALWVIVILVAIAFAGFICFGNFWLAEARENDRLRRENERLRQSIEEVTDNSFKSGYKTGLLLGGNGNV